VIDTLRASVKFESGRIIRQVGSSGRTHFDVDRTIGVERRPILLARSSVAGDVESTQHVLSRSTVDEPVHAGSPGVVQLIDVRRVSRGVSREAIRM